MSVKLKPEPLTRATKLTALVKNINQAKSSSFFWNGHHRLWASGNRFRLLTTDRSTFLEWNFFTEDPFEDEFDVSVDAGQFNAVTAQLTEGSHVEFICSGDLLTIRQGQRQIKMHVNPTSDYPGPDQSSDITPHQPQAWMYSAKPLRLSLAFVTPFIDFNNPNPTKSVATLEATDRLIGGKSARIAQVNGLDPIPTLLSFKQHTAKRVTAFLNEIQGDVKIETEADWYTFSCPEQGHKLMVHGEANGFSVPLENLDKKDHELLKICRKTLNSSLAFLAAVVSEDGKPLGLRFRGHEKLASIQLSTLSQDESMRSTDEFAIIRDFHAPANPFRSEEEMKPSSARDSHMKISSESLREVLAEMKTNFLEVKFYPKNKLFLVTEEVGGDGIGPIRSVLMTVARDKSQKEAQVEETPPVPIEPKTTPSLQVEDGQGIGHPLQVEDHPPLDSVTPAFPATENGTGSRAKGKHQK